MSRHRAANGTGRIRTQATARGKAQAPLAVALPLWGTPRDLGPREGLPRTARRGGQEQGNGRSLWGPQAVAREPLHLAPTVLACGVARD